MVFSNNLLMGAAGQATGYEIEQSIRFDNVNGVDAGGAQMFRLALTGTPTNTKQATISAWVKRATLGFNQTIAYAGDPNGSTTESIRFDTADTLSFQQASSDYVLTTTQVFRDIGAWYHIVAEIDTANGTSADRANLYVNGTKVTSFSTENYPTQDYVTNWTASSSSIAHTWGTNGIPSAGPSSQLFAGYMAEMFVLDGEKAGASSFGETNNDGVWVPIKYSGSFGNNGYYMTGETASGLGDDFSGNSLDFTTVDLATTDQMSDTPTKNWCTLSPIDKFGGGLTLSDGNLRAVPSASEYCNNHGTFYIDSGKWVFECKHTTVFGEACGWSPPGEILSGSSDRGYFMMADGRAYDNTTNTGTKGASLASGDFRYVFYDADAQAMWFAHVDVSSSNALVYDNSATKAEIEAGTTTNAVFTSIPAGFWAPGIWMDTSGVIEVNFGQSSFATSSDLPTGFNTLNTANLDTPTISDGRKYFDIKLWTGNDTDGRAITGYNFSPDWVWIKSRSGAYSHNLTDTVRAAGNYLQSSTSDAEVDGPGAFGSTLAFTSDGYTLDNGTSDNLYVNAGGETYVGWGWDANGSGSSNEDGSINTTATSANTTAGFSISTYTGTGANATVGHGLGVAPSFVIIKSRNDTHDWYVRTPALSGTEFILLNTNAVKGTSSPEVWNSTAPTSSIVNIGTSIGVNRSTYNYVMYCFAEISGYSSIGSYVGNGSASGPYVACGFKPAWVMGKRIAGSGGHFDWWLFDSKRPEFNVTNERIHPNNAQATDTGAGSLDLLSNGFKIRTTTSSMNNSGDTFLYMAFAENPFGGDGIAPATAR